MTMMLMTIMITTTMMMMRISFFSDDFSVQQDRQLEQRQCQKSAGKCGVVVIRFSAQVSPVYNYIVMRYDHDRTINNNNKDAYRWLIQHVCDCCYR